MINEKEIAKITSSIGVAEYQMNEGNQQFVHRADVTIYEAKLEGSNRMTISPAENEQSINAIPQYSEMLKSFVSPEAVEKP